MNDDKLLTRIVLRHCCDAEVLQLAATCRDTFQMAEALCDLQYAMSQLVGGFTGVRTTGFWVFMRFGTAGTSEKPVERAGCRLSVVEHDGRNFAPNGSGVFKRMWEAGADCRMLPDVQRQFVLPCCHMHCPSGGLSSSPRGERLRGGQRPYCSSSDCASGCVGAGGGASVGGARP